MTKGVKWAMLCKLKVKLVNSPGMTWERKYDGCRIRVDIDKGITLTARSGADKTAQFPDLVQALALMVDYGNAPLTLDGEVISRDGLSFQDFNQRRMNRTDDISKIATELPASFVAFDIMRVFGKDISNQPLCERRLHLQRVISRIKGPIFQLSEYTQDGVALFNEAKAHGWEGVVGKSDSGLYVPDSRRDWVKVKTWQTGNFYCVGYTHGTGRRAGGFGALRLSDAEGTHVGDVGTGFTDASWAEMNAKLTAMKVAENKGVCDIKTPFPVSIKFCERTNEGNLRFPVFLQEVHE